jgi:hypothetical protein
MSLLYQPTHSQPSAIPDTITLLYNSRNTSKHTQGPQNLAAPTPLPHLPPSCITFTNYPSFYL